MPSQSEESIGAAMVTEESTTTSSSSSSSHSSPGPKYMNPSDTCRNCKKAADEVSLKNCSRCLVSYCCQDCQREDWPEHKTKCSDIGLWNLLQAIEFNDLERVTKLSKSSPKVVNGGTKKLRGLQYFRPLIACVRYDNTEALRILLESGNATKVDAKDCDGDTALHMAASKRNNVDIIRLLLQHGANPNHCSDDGFPVLLMAARDYDVDNTRCILEAGVAPEVLEYTISRIQMMSGGSMLDENETFDSLMERKNRTLELLMQYHQGGG